MAAEPSDRVDVAIVGGGPAGLAAATELRSLGIQSVVVLERDRDIGGIPRHCGHYPFGMHEFNRVLRGPDYAARLAARARQAGVDVRTGASAIAIFPGPRLTLSTAEGLGELTARKILLATGVRERSRAARMIGGTKPGGVVSTGALQGLVYLDRIRPFLRPVILGTELVAFSALFTCRHLGIKPLAMIEPGARVTAMRAASLFPRLTGTALLLETEVTAIRGDRKVEEVVLRDSSGATRTLATDGVIVSGQFLPEASLITDSHVEVDPKSGGPKVDQFGRCSDPDVFAAGNLLRAVETAGWSWAEGRAVARNIARNLRGELPEGANVINVGVEGPLKYVVPQRITDRPREGGVAGSFQLRVTRPIRGTLRLAVDGREVWSSRIHSLPERRITLPVSILPAGAGTSAIFSVAEG